MSREAAPDWLLDEFAHAGRENLDAEHVHRYDSKMDASAPSETELPGTLGLGPNSVLVEIGVGTGQLTIAAAARCDRVIAVDVSPAMLARLFANLDDRGMCNVEIVEAGFLSYLFDPESVDFVYSRLALHHLPDSWKTVALRRIHDALKPGGVFRLWDVVTTSTLENPTTALNSGVRRAKRLLHSLQLTTDGVAGK